MPRQRFDTMRYRGNGFIRVRNQRELDLLLVAGRSLAYDESVSFEGMKWDDDEERCVYLDGYIPDAVKQVIAAGILPETSRALPDIRTRVQTIELGGKPGPTCRYGVGTVTKLTWDRTVNSWRVHVEFDHATGGMYGYPIYATSTFAWMVHVIGSDEQPFSEMTPLEIGRLYEERRLQLPAPPARDTGEETPTRDAEVPNERNRALAHFGDGSPSVRSEEDVAALLACPPSIAQKESIYFRGRDPYSDAIEGPWVMRSIATVIDARILPAPVSELPMFGSRVETIALANRQVDRYRSVVGRADWICWNGHSWTVSVRFDTSVTMRRGGRLPGCYSPVTMVREFGRGERPFSDMSADEVRTLFEACRSIAV